MKALERNVSIAQKEKVSNKVKLVLILGSLTAFGPLSMDMYLPGLPAVTEDLNTVASIAQLSITSCLLGLGVGQVLFGPLSDLLGRRKPLIVSLVLYAIVSLLCGFSANIWTFIGLRFAQGFTGAAGIVIARASARDMYSGNHLTQFIALLALVNGAAPILAPILGGIILKWITWEAVFYILSLIGFIMVLAVLFFLPETLSESIRSQGKLFAVFKSYGELVKDRVFISIALTSSFISMSLFAYIAASPFVLQKVYEITAQQFSFVFAMNGVGIIIAAQITGRLSKSVSGMTLLGFGIMLSLLGSSLFIISVLLDLPLWLVMIALFMVVSSVGVVGPTSFSLGMERHGKIAGAASAFLGILPFGGGALVSPLTGIAGDHTAIPMGIVILVCSALSLLAYVWLKKRISDSSIENKNQTINLSK